MPQSPSTSSLPDATRLGRTALRVADIDAVSGFYRDVVGLSVQAYGESTVTLGVADRPLVVLEDAEDVPPRRRQETGLYHNAFRVPSREALGDALQRIRGRWELSGASDHGMSEALYVRDPEKNGVEIYHDRPRDDWPLGADGKLRPERMSDSLDLVELESISNGNAQVPPKTDLGHIHLEESSVAAAREFYAETMGFDVTLDAPSVVFLSAGGYHHHVGVNTWRNRSEPIAGRGLSWFEIVVPTEDALEAVRERITDSSRSVTELDDGFEVTDPGGIVIRLRTEE